MCVRERESERERDKESDIEREVEGDKHSERTSKRVREKERKRESERETERGNQGERERERRPAELRVRRASWIPEQDHVESPMQIWITKNTITTEIVAKGGQLEVV